MDRKHKAYIKLNIITLFFIAISSISVTLAWFAYSGIARVSTEIDVKSWLIEFEKNDTTVSNDIVISLDDVYPGMTPITETIKIKNKGDSNARLSYSILSARILDEQIEIENVEQDYIKDKLSHDYPFSININLSDNFILSQEQESEFELSISWPLDSDNDKRDSEWANLAYQFGTNEQKKYQEDSTYKIRPSIKITIDAKAEQITESEQSVDINYPLGKMILYDVKNNIRCSQLNQNDNDTCIITHVIDLDNKIGDENVTLLPHLFGNYSDGTYDNYEDIYNTTISNWNVNTRELQIDDILKIVSKDINNSLIIREGLSDTVIGYMNYGERINTMIDNTVSYNGYYSFLNEENNYLVTNKCYWLNREYNETKAFALTKKGETTSKIYGEEKNNICSVTPIIIAPKKNLNVQ